jgi:hypothetical protein
MRLEEIMSLQDRAVETLPDTDLGFYKGLTDHHPGGHLNPKVLGATGRMVPFMRYSIILLSQRMVVLKIV